MKSKVWVLTLIGVCFCLIAEAQLRSETRGSFSDNVEPTIFDRHYKPKLALGVGVGFANMFGDLPTSIPMPAARIGLGSKVTNNLIIGFEVFFGQMSSSMPANRYTTGFTEVNSFEAIDFNAKVTLGNYLKYSGNPLMVVLSGIYVGSGFGIFNNDVNSFKGDFKIPKYSGIEKNFKAGMYTQMHTFSEYIPLNVGLRIHFKKFFGTTGTQFMLNYQMNYTFSDFLDGFSFSTSTARNKFNDCYTVITAGLSFSLSKK